MPAPIAVVIAAALCALVVAYSLDSAARRGRLAAGRRAAVTSGARAGLGAMLGLVLVGALAPYLSRHLGGTARPIPSHAAIWWVEAIGSNVLFGILIGAATGAAMGSWLGGRRPRSMDAPAA